LQVGVAMFAAQFRPVAARDLIGIKAEKGRVAAHEADGIGERGQFGGITRLNGAQQGLANA
jgi:hypothetical protein